MPVEIKVPEMGESVVEATISRWLKRVGDPVSAGEALVELETDKINVEVPADSAGVIERIDRKEGETVAVGDVLGSLSADGKAASREPAAAPEPAPAIPAKPAAANGAQKAAEEEERTPATPTAKQLAAANNVDLRMVKPSGPAGRVTKEDVATFIERRNQAPDTANRIAAQGSPATIPPTPAAPLTAPAVTGDRREERVRMSRRRQTIALRLKEALNTAAMLTTFNEADMSAVMEIRKKRKDAFKEKHGVNLGFMSFFTKACLAALKEFPAVNSELQGDELVLKHYYDLGVAVSTEEGLVVPVIRDVDKKSFAEIEKGIVDLATRARDGKLTLAELQGGTFTITNGGVFGSLLSTPILNTPQVGILGMHKIEERPVALNGQVVIRPMMYLALSYDHRIVDGREAVSFLVRVKELIEDPTGLLIEG